MQAQYPVRAVELALAVRARDGTLSYLSRSWSPANLMRTGNPARAETWSSEGDLRLWADGLPRVAKLLLAGREDLLVVPLHVEARPATHRFVFPESAVPPEPSPREPPPPEDMGPCRAELVPLAVAD